jgi:uncharacterized membrane protein YphA (DoxX/SURF4 family)
LRTTVGITAGIQGSAYLANSDNQALGSWVMAILAITTGASLLLGFLTQPSGVLLGLGSLGIALSWLPTPVHNLFDTPLSIIFFAVMAVEIILLGPGAFSVDARLLGRREIIIPAASHSSKL